MAARVKTIGAPLRWPRAGKLSGEEIRQSVGATKSDLQSASKVLVASGLPVDEPGATGRRFTFTIPVRKKKRTHPHALPKQKTMRQVKLAARNARTG